MPYDSARVHAALFFVKSVLSQPALLFSRITVFIVVCFSPVRGARKQTESMPLQNYSICLMNGFGLLKLCCQRPLITLQKVTYCIVICALLHCGMYAFALVLQPDVCRKYFC